MVTILGSGTCVPSLKRSACAAMVATNDQCILLDIGPGTMHRLLEAGIEVFDITHLFLSHFHPDHTGELATFLFANKYPDGRRRKRPLCVAGGPGLGTFFENLTRVYGRWIQLEDPLFRLLELKDSRAMGHRFPGFSVRTAPAAHNPESVAYRITDDDGASVVYSGDTDVCEELVTLAREADLLICESAMPEAHKARGHLTPAEAGRIAQRAGVGSLVLTHFYPECDQADMAAEARHTWSGPLILAEDLMTIPVIGNAPEAQP
jgi:ribonuclease BN (tRNA processing enzyme)